MRKMISNKSIFHAELQNVTFLRKSQLMWKLAVEIKNFWNNYNEAFSVNVTLYVRERRICVY